MQNARRVLVSHGEHSAVFPHKRLVSVNNDPAISVSSDLREIAN